MQWSMRKWDRESSCPCALSGKFRVTFSGFLLRSGVRPAASDGLLMRCCSRQKGGLRDSDLRHDLRLRREARECKINHGGVFLSTLEMSSVASSWHAHGTHTQTAHEERGRDAHRGRNQHCYTELKPFPCSSVEHAASICEAGATPP